MIKPYKIVNKNISIKNHLIKLYYLNLYWYWHKNFFICSFFLFIFLLLLIKYLFLILQIFIDYVFIGLRNITCDQKFIENEVSLYWIKNIYTLWKLKIKSNSQTLPKYLSKTSTNVWINSKIINSF